MSVAPPPAIEERLAALVPRVRVLRVARGAARFAVTILGAVCVVLLLDGAFELAAWVRVLFLSVWLTAAGVLAWRWIVIPWRAEIPLSEVAAELEKTMPELGERLRAVVSDAPPGQPDSIRAALIDDANRRTKSVNLAKALPAKPMVAACAAIVLLAFAVTVGIVAGAGERVRRVALPWSRPPAAAFRIVVTSGEPVVKRGDSITLSAYAERAGTGAPTEATIIFRDKEGAPETREPMTGDGGAFHFKRSSTTTNFEYCIEIGTARSDWFRVTALDPVELAPDTRIEITAPEYTGARKRTLTTFSDFDGLASGTAHFNFKFTREAAAVYLEWKPHDAPKADLIAVDLTTDRLSAAATFTMRTGGTLKLVLVRDVDGKKLSKEAVANVTVAQDEPPRLTQVRGITPRPRTARPGAHVPFFIEATDDWGVTGASLLYKVGAGPVVTVPIALTGGINQVTGALDFDLTGKANAGDTVFLQLTVADNFRDPDKRLGPQTTVYPPNGWSELKLVPNAPPLEQQDIGCQRDALHESLASAARAANELADEATSLRDATAGGAALTVDQSSRLNALKEKTRAAVVLLHATANGAALTRELRPLAADVRALADQWLKLAEDALRKAESDSAARAGLLSDVAAHLNLSQGTLKELIDRNAKFARERLDRAKLSALATDQNALVEAAKNNSPDLLARQKDLLARLDAIVAESDVLRAASGAAKDEEVRRLATAFGDRVSRLRELDAAAREAADDIRAGLAATISRDQDALAKNATTVFADLDTAARLAGVALPKPDDFRRIADLAAAGKTVEALTELEKHGQALAQIATAFEKWASERTDPKFAAKQFAQWQDDLLARLRAATKGTTYEKLPEGAKAVFRAEHKALHAAIGSLALPPESAKGREEVALHTGRASDLLAADGIGADAAMKRAYDAWIRLSMQIPTVGDRHTKTLRALDPLRQELDVTANAIEQALRGSDKLTPDAIAKKLAASADRQRKLIAGVAALDLPGLSERQARVVSATTAAVTDMQDGSVLDVQASQAWVKREFDRLKFVLEGNPAADARADELHHKLATIAASLDAHGPAITKQHVEPAAPLLQEVWRQLAVLVAPEAPGLLNDARNAVQSAEVGIRDAKPVEARRRIHVAAEALGKLADRLNGFEPDYDRVNRLAARCRLASEKPKELLFSDEAQRQLAREVDELTHTRVGAAGQAHKKRALDLYAKLRAKTDPDRLGSDLKALATTLDELAAKMADVAELAVGNSRGTMSTGPGAADLFLPSKPHADALRDLVKQQRALKTQVTNFATELVARLRPTANNPLAALDVKQRALALDALTIAREANIDSAPKAADAVLRAADRIRVGKVLAAKEAGERAAESFRQLATVGSNKRWGTRAAELAAKQDEITKALSAFLNQPRVAATQQVVRATELAREAGEFAIALEAASRALAVTDAAGITLIEAAKLARAAEKHLDEAAKKATEGNTGDAEKLRAAAEATLRDAGNTVARAARAAPPAPLAGVNVELGDAIRAADRAMRRAADALATESDPAAVRKAMLDAVQVLKEVGK